MHQNNQHNNNQKNQQNNQNNNQNNNQDPNTQQNQKMAQQAAKQIMAQYNSTLNNRSSIQAFCKGEGFSLLNGLTQSETTVVDKCAANDLFLSCLDTCAQIMNQKAYEIAIFREQFKNCKGSVFKKVLPHVDEKLGRLKILNLEYIKKRKNCFLSYTVMSYEFKLAPHILKKKIESSFSHNSKNKIGFGGYEFDFSTSSSESYSQEKLVARDRGMTMDDMNMLIELANVSFGENTRPMILKMFIDNQFDDIDY